MEDRTRRAFAYATVGSGIDAFGGAVFGADSTLRMRSSNRIRLPDVSFISLARLPKTREPIPTLAPDHQVCSRWHTEAQSEPVRQARADRQPGEIAPN